MSMSRRAALLGLPMALGGCSWLDSIFGDSKTPLPGTREPVITQRRGLEISADPSPIVIPAPSQVTDWPQAGGTPTHVVGNVAVSGLTPAWSSSIGEGGGYRARIMAQPVVAGGRIFTMDSDGEVAAFDVASGRRQWRTETQPRHDRSTNLGGGIAIDGNVVYASTGRAEALALDAATGNILWRKDLGSPARSAPTLSEGKLYITTLDDRLVALAAKDGERSWAYQASTSDTTVLSGAAPAASEGLIVAGFSSGELVTIRADSGVLAWSDSLAASRGRSSVVDLSAIRALPVIDNGRVFAIGVGGLLAALDLRSGRRLWERDVGGGQTPWIAGDWMYVQTTDQSLAAIGRDDGRVRWVQDLPRWDDQVKQRDPIFWSGPVMVNGRLVLAGTDAKAVSVDAKTGAILGQSALSDSTTVPPVAAAGSLFIVSDDGTLQAFR